MDLMEIVNMGGR